MYSDIAPSIIRNAKGHVPESIRALWNIPIEDVVVALEWSLEEIDGCKFEYECAWNEVFVEINTKTNDWKFGIVDTRGDIFMPLDFDEIKTTIDLVVFMNGCSFDKAVAFLQDKFPAYKI